MTASGRFDAPEGAHPASSPFRKCNARRWVSVVAGGLFWTAAASVPALPGPCSLYSDLIGSGALEWELAVEEHGESS